MRALVLSLVIFSGACVCGGPGGGAGGGSGGGVASGGGTGGSGGSPAGGGSGGAGGSGGGAFDAGTPRVLGFSYDFNPVTDAGQFELRKLDVLTGASTTVGVLVGLNVTFQGRIADVPAGLIYVLGETTLNGTQRVFTVDANTGAVLRSNSIDRPTSGDYQWNGGIHLRADGGLVGLAWNGPEDGGSEELRTIDPLTGNTGLVAKVPGIESLASFVNTSDPVQDRIYVVGGPNNQPRPRLIGISLTTGQVMSQPVVDAGTDELIPFAIFLRSNGKVAALAGSGTYDGGTPFVCDFGTTTGDLTRLNRLPHDSIYAEASTLDRVLDRITFIDDQSTTAVARVLTVDAATGQVFSSPVLQDVAIPSWLVTFR